MQHTLGITDCGLFDPAHERVHFTSALRYPVFVDGANYNGNPLGRPLLRGMVERFLAEEVRQLPGALWLPLGPKPAAALRHLVSLGILPADRVLEGLPHQGRPQSARHEAKRGRPTCDCTRNECSRCGKSCGLGMIP